MAATKISVHLVPLNLGEELVIDHVESGWVQVFDMDYRGGEGRGRDYLVGFAIIEPCGDDEAKEIRSREPGTRGERFGGNFELRGPA